MDPFLITQLRISLVVYVGQLIVGYALGWTAPVLPKLEDINQTPLPDILSHGQASWIGSVVYIGTIIGSLGASISIASFIILALAQNLAMVFAGRILLGMGAGIVFVTNLVYVGEIAPTNLRGILLTGIGIFSTMGTLVVYSVGPYVKYSAVNWIGFGISVAYFIGLLSIPETPLYFVLKGEEEKAKRALFYLGRHDDNAVLSTKIDPNDADWNDLFTVRSNRKAMVGSSLSPDVSTIMIGVTQMVASIAAPMFVERNGRKFLMMMSTASCCLSLAVCGVFMYLNEYHIEAAQKVLWLPLITLIVFFLSYDLGFGVIPGTLIGEMFQSNVRSTGSALTITVAWLFGLGVSAAFEYMVAGLGAYSTFWIYSGACAVAFFFTWFCVPETKGKTFEEIQDILNGRSLKR